LALLVALPVGALERVPAPESRSNAGLLAQAKSEIPPEILALEKKASELYGRGEPQQALALIQQLMAWVNTNLPRNDPYRAKSQTWMGLLLSAVGRRQEALAPTEEAVKTYRELAKTNPAFLGDLAASLNNLGLFQLALGQPEQARSAYAESIAIIRPLADTNPAFQQDLQRTLNNLEELNRK
jgi:tetratricopeptide (TPR) repeat protein